MIYLKLLIVGLSLTYALWIFFICVMGLKRVRDAGLLSKTAYVLGEPVAVFGLVLDIFVNFTVMTLLLLEIPQEATVTGRLSRHINDSTGWRKAIALWAAPLLDPFDPSGKHLK